MMHLKRCTIAAIALCLLARPCIAQDDPEIRELAEGVLTTIPLSAEDGETLTGPIPLVEVVNGIPDLDWTPNYAPKTRTLFEKAKHVTFRRPIWELELSFKPLRMVWVDIPQPTGKMQRKLIWYLVYRVSNRGLSRRPKAVPDDLGQETFEIERVNYQTRRFFPHFVLESLEYDKAYMDRIIPSAQKLIQERENPGANIKLLNSIEMSQVRIPLSDERIERGVWGLVTWEDVDPRIDFFSIYVRGLTNAFKFVDPPGAYKAGQPPGSGRVFSHKTLQMNFWRPGDSVLEHEGEIRFGVPVDPDPVLQNHVLTMFGLPERLDHRWIYR